MAKISKVFGGDFGLQHPHIEEFQSAESRRALLNDVSQPVRSLVGGLIMNNHGSGKR